MADRARLHSTMGDVCRRAAFRHHLEYSSWGRFRTRYLRSSSDVKQGQ